MSRRKRFKLIPFHQISLKWSQLYQMNEIFRHELKQMPFQSVLLDKMGCIDDLAGESDLEAAFFTLPENCVSKEMNTRYF